MEDVTTAAISEEELDFVFNVSREQARAQDMRAALAPAVEENPDTYSEIAKISQRTGVPVSALQDDRRRGDVVQRSNFMDFDWEGFAQKNPATATLMSDPHFARLAHDDLENMGAIEQSFRAFGQSAKSATRAIFENTFYAPEAVGRMTGGGEIGDKTSLPSLLSGLLKFTGSTFISPIGDKLKASREEAEADNPTSQLIAEKQQLADEAFEAALTGDFKQLGTVLTDPVSWASFIGNAVPSLAAAVASGGSLTVIGALEALDQVSDAREFEQRTGTKISDGDFTQAIAQTAALNTLLEKAGLDAVLGRYGSRATRVVGGAVGEGTTELLQEFNTNLSAKIAYDPDRSLTRGVLPGFVGGFGSGGVVGGISAVGSPRLPVRFEMAVRAEEQTQAVEKLTEIVQASKIVQRDPESFERLIETVSAESDVTDIFLDPNELKQSGIDLDALADVSPSVAKQKQIALESGGLLKIPLAEYAASVAPSELGGLLLDHVKTDALAMSRREAQEFLQSAQDEFAQEAERAAQATQDADAFTTSRDAVQEQIVQQLAEANRFTKDVNPVYASVLANFFAVTGQRMSMTAEELYAQYPVKIQAEGTQGTVFNAPLNPDVDPARQVEAVDLTASSAATTTAGVERYLKNLASGKENIIPTADEKRLMKLLPKKAKHIAWGARAWRSMDVKQRKVRSKSATNIADLIERAVLVETTKNTKTKEKPDVELYHRFYVPVKNGPSLYTVRLTAEQTAKGLRFAPDMFELYDITVEDKKPSLSGTANPKGTSFIGESEGSFKPSPSVTANQEGTSLELEGKGLSLSIKEMLSGVKDAAGDSYFQSTQPADFLQSALLREAADLKQAKGTGSQMLAMLRKQAGVKEEEIAWTGLDEFLQGKKSVTRQEIVDYLNDNQVRVEEVTLVDDDASFDAEVDNLINRYGDIGEIDIYAENTISVERLIEDGIRFRPMYRDSRLGDFKSEVDAENAIYEAARTDIDRRGGTSSFPKFAEYTLPGGENYREVLLTLPNPADKLDARRREIEAIGRDATEKEKQEWVGIMNRLQPDNRDIEGNMRFRGMPDYRSSHFDQPNILAHVRLNDRTDVEGSRVLFVEEIQSDWHQAGRKKGYKNPTAQQQYIDAVKEAHAYAETLKEKYGQTFWGKATAEERAEHSRLHEKASDLEAAAQSDIPDAPFKKTWHEMAFRRVAQMAAQQGYDRIAWTTGEQQNERFDLSKSVDKVIWDEVGERLAAVKDGKSVIEETGVNRGNLEDYVGKDVAARLAEQEENSSGRRSLEGDGLKVGGDGMKGFYDKILPTYAKKFGKKYGAEVGEAVLPAQTADYDGVTQDRELLNELGVEPDAAQDVRVWSLPVTESMRESANRGFELFQEQRGSFNPDTLTISLLNAADLSTFLHEAGHFFLEVVNDLATRPDAPADIKQDMDTVLEWLGVPSLDDWNNRSLEEQREAHEQFARGFEAYLFEGKAPSVELRGIFARMKDWLLAVYKNLTGLNVALNDEVRGVFDRLLATDTAIAEAENLTGFTSSFASAEDAGMSAEEWAEYQKLGREATETAEADLAARSLREMRWASNARGRELKRLQQETAAKRKAVKREVTEEVMGEPVNRLKTFLARGTIDGEKRSGPHRMDIDALIETYGDKEDALWKSLPSKYGQYGTLGKDGLHPDILAEMFGFTSGDHMLREMLAAEDPQDKIIGLTEQRLLERYGDITSPRALEEAADRAIHNDARIKFVAAEVNALRKATGQKKILREAAKDYARAMVGRLKVRDVKPSRYTAAEARAARAAQDAMRKGDLQTAAAEKRAQLVQMYAAKEAYAAQEEIEKTLKYYGKFNKDGVRNKIATEYLDQIDQLLERYDLRKGVTLKALEKRATLLAWYEDQQAMGFEPDIPQELLLEAGKRHYKDVPLEELRGLTDTIRQVEHLGKLKNKLLTARDQRNFDLAKVEIIETIEENATGAPRDLRTRPNAKSALLEGARWFNSLHRKMANLARQMDGFKDGGTVWGYLIRTMNDAGNAEAVMTEEATKKLHELTRPLLDGSKMGGKGAYFPAVGMSLNREERIAIALNTGNQGNLQRLLDGEGWTPEQLRSVLDSLTDVEADFVQNIWDFFEGYRPQIAAKEKRVYGREPEWVEPSETVIGGKTLKGGYYPIKYDSNRSIRAAEHADAESARQQLRGAYTSATTRRSFTKTRAEAVKGRPLLYSLQGLYQGTTEVIHDLTHHEWLIDANRLLRDKEIDEAIRRNYGPEGVGVFKSAVQDIAAGQTPAQDVWERSLNHIRIGSTVAGLGWNLFTSLLQPLGLTNSMARIGPGWVGTGLKRWLGTPGDVVETEIYVKSDFMRLRGKTMQREINEIQNRVSGGKSKAGEFMDLSFFWLIQKAQIVADVPTWLGQYEKSMAQHGDEARAVAEADQAVIDSQGGGQVKDLAAIQRGGPMRKLWTNFYSYFSVVYNLNSEIKNRTDWRDPAEVAVAARDYLLVMVAPAVISALMRAALYGGDDDDELLEKVTSEVVGYMFGTMIGVREAGAIAQKAVGLSDFGYSGPAGLRFFNELDRFGTQAAQGEVDRALRKSTINTAGILFHLPSGQINRTWDGVEKMMDGKTSNPLSLVTGGPRE